MATEQGYNPSVAVNEIYDTIQEKPQEMIHTRAYINLDAKTGWIPSTVGAYKYQLDITLPAREFPVTLEYQPQVIIQPNTDPTCGPLNFPYAETVGLDKVRLYAMSIPKAERMLPIMLIMQQTGAPYGSTNASSSVRTDLEVEPQGIQLSQNIVYVKTREGKDTSGNYVTLVDGDQTFRLTVTGYKGDAVAKVIVQPNSPNAYMGEDFKYKLGRYFLIYNLDGTPLVTPTHIPNSDDTWTEYSSATPLSQKYNIGYQNLGQIGNQVDAAVFLKDGTVVSKGSFYLQFNVQLENGPVFTARASIFTNKVVQEEVDPMTYEMLVPSVHRNASNYYTVDNRPVADNPFTPICRIIDQSGETVNATAELRLKTLNNEIISWNDGGEQTSFFTNNPLTDLSFLNDYNEFILEWVIDNRVKVSRLVNIASSGNSYFLTTSSEYIDTTNLVHDSSVAFQAFLFTKNENDQVSTFNGQIKVFGKDVNNQETLLSTESSAHLITQIYKEDVLEYRIEATIGSYVTQTFISTVVPVKDTENIFFSFKPAVLVVETNAAFALVNTPGSNSNEISFDIRRNTGVINDQFEFDVTANNSIMHNQPNLEGVSDPTVSYFNSNDRTIRVLRMEDPGVARIEYTITATNKVHKSQKIIAQVSAVRQVNTTVGMVVNLYYLYSDYPKGKNEGVNNFSTSIKKSDNITDHKYTGFLNSIESRQPLNPELYTWVLTNPSYVDLVVEDLAKTWEATINSIQDQIDGSITTWFYEEVPTTSNVPASAWDTPTLKNKHLGDLYYNTVTGYAYRWQVVNNVYSWVRITDTDVTKALEDASRAQDTADAKRRVFVEQPVPPYEVGDLWVQGVAGDLMRCKITRATGTYNDSDWIKASKYTDDTTANANLVIAQADATDKANAAQAAAEAVAVAQAALAQTNAEAYADGIVDAEEAERIAQDTATLEAAKADAAAKATAAEDAAKAYVDTELTNFATIVDEDISDLQTQIDGKITTWFYAVAPTTANDPASTWTTKAMKDAHIGDLYYNTSTGQAYRWKVVSTTYSWELITDNRITAALANASTAKDVADSKRRVFGSTPTPPYDVNDLWVQGTDGDIMRCITASTTSYSEAHWVKAVKYTDDTKASQAIDAASAASVKAGTAVATSLIQYALSSSPTNFVLISGKDWSLTAPTPVEGQYLWSRTKNTLINGSESYYPSSTGTNVSGIQGTGGLSVLLLNEHQSIAVNSDRKASFNQIVTIPFTAFKGTTRLAATATLTGFPTTLPTISPVITAGTASNPGTIVFTIPSGHAFSSLTVSGDTGSFQINITAGGQTISRIFSYSKSIPGTRGTSGVSPTIYQLKCDTEIIKRRIDGTLVPNTISVSAVSITGSSHPKNYDGIFKLFYGDSVSGTQADATKLFNLNGTDQGFIRIVLAKSDDSSILYDEQTIPIINEDPYRYTLRALSPPIGDGVDENSENIIYTTSQYQNNPPEEILPYLGELITYEKIDLENMAFNKQDGKILARQFNWTLVEPPTTYYRYSKNSNGEGLIDIDSLNNKPDKQDYKYMGVLTTFQTSKASDPRYYTWLLIQGPQGPQGNQGNPGPPSKEVLISGDTVLKLWRNGVDYVADQQTLIYSLNTQLEFNSVTWYYNNQEITSLDNPTFTILTDPSTKTSTLTIPTADAEIKNLSSLVISAKIYDTVGGLLGSDYISTYFLHDQSTNYYAEIVANTQARNHIFERDQYGNVLKDTIKSESLVSGSIGFYLELKVYQGAILLNSDQYTSKRTDMGCIISVIDNRYYFQDIIANSGSVEAEVSIHGLQVPITLHPKFSWIVKENVVDSIKRDLQISSDTSGFVNRLLTVDDLNKLESEYDNNIANYSAGFDNQNISVLVSSENTTPDRYFSSINGGLDLKPILFNGCLSGELFGETNNVSVIPGQYFLIHMPSGVSSTKIWLTDFENSAKKTLQFVSVNFRGVNQQVTIIKIPPGHLFVGRDGSTIKMYRIAAPSGGDLFNRVNFSPFANYTTAITASFLNQYKIVASPFDFKILPSGEESLIISSNIATDRNYFTSYKTELMIIVKGYFGEQQRINLNRSFLPFNSTVEALKLIKDLSTSDKMSQQDILIVKRMIETLSKDSEYEIGRATSTLKYRVPEIALPVNEGEASSKNLIITRQLSDSLILEAENIPVSIAGFQESLSNQNAMYAATLDREDHVLLKIVVNNDGLAGPPAQLKINMRELSVENGQQKAYLVAQPGRTIENPLSLAQGENIFYFYSEGLLPENHLMGDKTGYEESNNSYKAAAWDLAKAHKATIDEGDSFLRESSAIDTDRFNVLYFDFIDLLSQRNLTLKEFTLFRYRPEIILTEQVLSELSVGGVQVQTLVQTLVTALSRLNRISFTSGTTDLIIDTPKDLEEYYTTALTSYQDLKNALNQAELIRNNSKQLKIQTENNYFSVGYYDKNQFVSGLQIDPLTGTLIQDSRIRVLGSTSIGALYGRKFVIGKEPTQEDLLEDKQNQYTWNNGHISIWSEGRWSSTLDRFGQTFFRYNVVENQTTLTGYMVMNSKEIAAYNIKPDAPLSFTSSTTPNVHDAAMVRDRIFEITGEGDIFIQDLSLGTDGSVDFFESLTLIGYSSSSSSYYKLDGTSDSKSSKGMVFVGGNN